MQIIFQTTKPRKKPKVGDEKVVNGVTMVRQFKRIDGCVVKSNGRYVYEWVEKVGAA